MSSLNGILDQFDLRRQGGLVVGGQVDQNMAVGSKRRMIHLQLIHQLLIPAGTGYAVQAAKPGKDRLHIRRSKKGPIQPVSFHD